MIDPSKPIQVADDDAYRVTVSANIQSFHYIIRLFPSDGAGGFLDGDVIANGDNANPVFTKPGAEIHNSIVQVCVTHGGHTTDSVGEIVAQIDVVRANGDVDQVKTLSIPAGLGSAEFRCFALQFQ